LMHVIIAEGLHDRSFVARHTTGFAELASHVAQHSPEWAERETGVSAPAIRALARRYAATKQSMILIGGSSMHKSANRCPAGPAITGMPALTGAVSQPGGGMGARYPPRSSAMGMSHLEGEPRQT